MTGIQWQANREGPDLFLWHMFLWGPGEGKRTNKCVKKKNKGEQQIAMQARVRPDAISLSQEHVWGWTEYLSLAYFRIFPWENKFTPAPNNFSSNLENVPVFHRFHKSLSCNHLSTVSMWKITTKSWTNLTAPCDIRIVPTWH